MTIDVGAAARRNVEAERIEFGATLQNSGVVAAPDWISPDSRETPPGCRFKIRFAEAAAPD